MLSLVSRDQKQDGFAARLLGVGDALFEVSGRAHGLVADAHDDVAGTESLVRGFAVGIDRGHHDAGDLAIDVELLPRLSGERHQLHAE